MSSPDVMVPPEILDAIKARLLESVEQGMEDSGLSPIQLDLLFHAGILDVRSRVKQMIQDRMKDMQYIEACRVPVDWTRTTQEAFVATERKLRVRDSTVDGEVLCTIETPTGESDFQDVYYFPRDSSTNYTKYDISDIFSDYARYGLKPAHPHVFLAAFEAVRAGTACWLTPSSRNRVKQRNERPYSNFTLKWATFWRSKDIAECTLQFETECHGELMPYVSKVSPYHWPDWFVGTKK